MFQLSTVYSNISGFAFMAKDFYPRKTNSEIVFLLDLMAFDRTINNDRFFESYIEPNPQIKITVAKNNTFIVATKKGIINAIVASTFRSYKQ